MIDHLWQSTLFAMVVGLLTLAFRRNRARVRYALWFVASVKFLVPFSLIDVARLGHRVERASLPRRRHFRSAGAAALDQSRALTGRRGRFSRISRGTR